MQKNINKRQILNFESAINKLLFTSGIHQSINLKLWVYCVWHHLTDVLFIKLLVLERRGNDFSTRNSYKFAPDSIHVLRRWMDQSSMCNVSMCIQTFHSESRNVGTQFSSVMHHNLPCRFKCWSCPKRLNGVLAVCVCVCALTNTSKRGRTPVYYIQNEDTPATEDVLGFLIRST